METINLVGQRIGMWTVLEEAPSLGKGARFLCRCDCGTVKIVSGSNLRRGMSLCCGSKVHSPVKTHGKSNTKLYRVWTSMRDRCYRPSNKNYKNYGARGIVVDPIWLGEDGFQNFWDWAHDNGYVESDRGNYTLDRIDVNGNYEPSNCRWITTQEQNFNKRNSIYLEHDGEIKSLKEWCELYGTHYNTAHNRVMTLRKNNSEITFEKVIY